MFDIKKNLTKRVKEKKTNQSVRQKWRIMHLN